MAVKSTWKQDLGKQVTFEVRPNVELHVFLGPIGPQIDLSTNQYLPGDMKLTQYDLFSKLGNVNRSKYVVPIKDSIKYLEP